MGLHIVADYPPRAADWPKPISPDASDSHIDLIRVPYVVYVLNILTQYPPCALYVQVRIRTRSIRHSTTWWWTPCLYVPYLALHTTHPMPVRTIPCCAHLHYIVLDHMPVQSLFPHISRPYAQGCDLSYYHHAHMTLSPYPYDPTAMPL